mmetsp:Transcript_70930/g.148377  ORF Transcript_70930/g.148377 Transcript_70930/m.148377 type:complete len:175 (+) Transcript_70930:88-612(+)
MGDRDRRRDRSRSRDRRPPSDEEDEVPDYMQFDVNNPTALPAPRKKTSSNSRPGKMEPHELRMDDEDDAERKKLADDAARMDRTVMVVGLGAKVDERDVFEFFVSSAGKVRDVQVIRDARTGRCKGVAYVEFQSAEGTVRAMRLNGQALKGATLRIQPSQAESGSTHASQSYRY